MSGILCEDRWHGTHGGYTNHRCRCERCSAAHAAYQSVVRSTDAYKEWRKIQVRAWRAARKAGTS